MNAFSDGKEPERTDSGFLVSLVQAGEKNNQNCPVMSCFSFSLPALCAVGFSPAVLRKIWWQIV